MCNSHYFKIPKSMQYLHKIAIFYFGCFREASQGEGIARILRGFNISQRSNHLKDWKSNYQRNKAEKCLQSFMKFQDHDKKSALGTIQWNICPIFSLSQLSDQIRNYKEVDQLDQELWGCCKKLHWSFTPRRDLIMPQYEWDAV